MRFVVFLFTLFMACSAWAFDGVVVSVHDGDTLTVVNEIGANEVVRLHRVDAPETGYSNVPYQPYANNARVLVSNLCLGRTASILRVGTSYNRTVGAVSCGGVDVGTLLLRSGAAWAYRYTSTAHIREIQAEAKASGVGLWAIPGPVEPYLWRRGVR